MACTHAFSRPVLGCRTSPYLQAKLVLLGAQHVFADVPELVQELLGIRVSTSQVYRQCLAAAAVLPAPDAPAEEVIPPFAEAPQAPLYGMIDGSMLSFDAGWQEVKVGRIFRANAVDSSDKTTPISWQQSSSTYVAQRGPYASFTARFEALLPAQPLPTATPLVFVTDGAHWMHHWLQASYPHATHILDYYHVIEQLATVAPAADQPTDWLDAQKQQLLEGKSTAVEAAVRALPDSSEPVRTRVANYLRANHERMQYAAFRQRGLMIGSGPIEAAHRSLLQVRMKRSGQRWSEAGGDKLIQLRVAVLSQQTERIKNIFRRGDAKF